MCKNNLRIHQFLLFSVILFFIYSQLALGVEDVTVNPIYPLSGADWNDYVRYAQPEKGAFRQPDEACNPNDGKNFSCLHGGELKKIDNLNIATCEDLVITDALGAFNWQCVDGAEGAQIFSSSLKSSKSLQDLLNVTTWKINSVTIANTSGEILFASDPAIWWGNPIISLNSQTSAPVVLKAEGSIYTLSKAMEWESVTVKDDKLSFVLLPGAQLKLTAKTNCPAVDVDNKAEKDCDFVAQNINHFWFESRVNNMSVFANEGRLLLDNVKFSRFYVEPNAEMVMIINNTSDNVLYSSATDPALSQPNSRNRFLTP